MTSLTECRPPAIRALLRDDCSHQRYLIDPRLTRATTSATRLPGRELLRAPSRRSPASQVRWSRSHRIPPPPLMTIIWWISIAPRMVSIVTSLPLETPPPVANTAPNLIAHVSGSSSKTELEPPVVKDVLTCPDMLPTYTGEPTMTASADEEVVAYHFTDPL